VVDEKNQQTREVRIISILAVEVNINRPKKEKFVKNV